MHFNNIFITNNGRKRPDVSSQCLFNVFDNTADVGDGLLNSIEWWIRSTSQRMNQPRCRINAFIPLN